MRTIIFLSIVIFLFIGGVFLVGGRLGEEDKTQPTFTPPDRIAAQHRFRDGVHTITGTMRTPTPCYALEHAAQSHGTSSMQVDLQFSIERITTHCVHTPVKVPFTVHATASPQAQFNAEVNDTPVSLSLTEMKARKRATTSAERKRATSTRGETRPRGTSSALRDGEVE